MPSSGLFNVLMGAARVGNTLGNVNRGLPANRTLRPGVQAALDRLRHNRSNGTVARRYSRNQIKRSPALSGFLNSLPQPGQVNIMPYPNPVVPAPPTAPGTINMNTVAPNAQNFTYPVSQLQQL